MQFTGNTPLQWQYSTVQFSTLQYSLVLGSAAHAWVISIEQVYLHSIALLLLRVSKSA